MSGNEDVPNGTRVPGDQGRTGWRPAELRRRFGALVLDWVLCTLAAGFLGPPQRYPWAPSAVLLVEYAFFLGLFGQTPGMYLARIRCAPAGDPAAGRPIGVPRAIVRGFLLILVVPALVMDADRRGLHDRAAGSTMVAA